MGGYQGSGYERGAHAYNNRDQYQSAAKSVRRRSGVSEESASGSHAVFARTLRRDDVAAVIVGHYAGIDGALLSHHDRKVSRWHSRDHYVVHHVPVVVQAAEKHVASTRRRYLQIQQ